MTRVIFRCIIKQKQVIMSITVTREVDLLLDERSMLDKQLVEADIEATKVLQEMQYDNTWWRQSKLTELIKKIQRIRNQIFGIDLSLNQKVLIAA